MYLARVAGVKGGLPVETPALTLNRLCGSGLQAMSAAQTIMLGDTDVAVAGGAKHSRGPYWAPTMRWGARMNDTKMVDAMVGALSDPFDDCHMGITAENVAKRWEISREDQDALAVESHRRGGIAIKRPLQERRSCRSRSKSRGARRCSTPTRMCAGTQRSRSWPSSDRCSTRAAR